MRLFVTFLVLLQLNAASYALESGKYLVKGTIKGFDEKSVVLELEQGRVLKVTKDSVLPARDNFSVGQRVYVYRARSEKKFSK